MEDLQLAQSIANLDKENFEDFVNSRIEFHTNGLVDDNFETLGWECQVLIAQHKEEMKESSNFLNRNQKMDKDDCE